ncbi:MAG: helix-turn-helix transcriptional regulator [Enterococcus lacertideformus]|uniref:Helix-turn-helix transcriptional regulator n=1 Tax=Enterococcus lacertideformus TaxID=2771493 RepID=A0A931FC99_9ENTE|nr:helix-turn-helix transcriptional regulator [Enterococcus lacertideformus]
MTQEQVAKQIFVSQKSVSNWETQKTYPDIESLIRLAHLYDLSLDHLLLEGSDIVKDKYNEETIYITVNY